MYQEKPSRESQSGDVTEQMKSKASDAAEQIKSKAGGASDQVRAEAGDAAGEARDQAKEVAARAQSYVSGQVDDRSTQAGQWMRKTGEDMRGAASGLREKGDDLPARINEQIGARVERLGSYMERTSGDQLLNDLQNFARDNVWALAAGGFVLGLVASRMVGASLAMQRHDDDGPSYTSQYPTSAAVVSGPQSGDAEYTGPMAVPYPPKESESAARYGSG